MIEIVNQCHHFCNEPLRCPSCIRRFWKWAENHTRGKAKRKRHEGVPTTALSFYEAAVLWKS